MKPIFLISSPFDTYSGYGARSRDLIKSIIETDKYRVKLISQPWGNTRFEFCKNNPEWEFLYDLNLSETLTDKPEIWAQITVPNEFKPMGKFNIGFTAGIESTLVNGEWVEGMNRMDLNIVSSEHSKNAFLNSKFEKKNQQGQVLGEIKVIKPIEVLFEGVNLDTYYPTKEPCLIDFDIKESFAYLFVGHWLQGELGQDRKNVGLLVKAFFETFKNKSKQPALILKTSGSNSSYMDRNEILRKINSIKNSCEGKLPNVYLLHGDFTDKEMNSIYNHSKVKAMISLTKGEGFGRPLLEFTLTKKPLIATAWSGQMDYLKPEFTTLIGGDLDNVHPSAANHMLLKESQWFSPNHVGISKSLKSVFENYKKHSELGKRQGHYSKTNFSWDDMKSKLDNILSHNIPEFPTQIELTIPKLNLPAL
jgi:glycosyltransferase involved in cell wall biosynthesis